MNLLHRIVRKIRKSEYHDIQELRQRGIHIGKTVKYTVVLDLEVNLI